MFIFKKVHKSSTFEYLSLCGTTYATAKYQGTLKSTEIISINLTKSTCIGEYQNFTKTQSEGEQ